MNPILGKVQKNVKQARAIIREKIDELQNLDALILPEMLFSGYVFHSRSEIEPFLEDPTNLQSPTIEFAIETARMLGSYVVCGFPERAGSLAYNSQFVATPNGSTAHIYRKHFLYETDETWAAEGSEFETCDLPGIGKTGFGICMDLNPYRFQTPFEDFEYASAMRSADAEVLLLSMNWIAHEGFELRKELHAYWRLRLYPLRGKSCVAAIANRTGIERNVRFAGCSCVIDLKTNTVLASLDEKEEGLLICEV